MRQPKNGKGANPETGDALEIAQLGRKSNSENTRIGDDAQAIYDGRSLIGWLRSRQDGRVDVIDCAFKSLGRFNTRQAAFVALIEHSRRGAA